MPELVLPVLVAFAGPLVALALVAIDRLTAPSLSAVPPTTPPTVLSAGDDPTSSRRPHARMELTHG